MSSSNDQDFEDNTGSVSVTGDVDSVSSSEGEGSGVVTVLANTAPVGLNLPYFITLVHNTFELNRLCWIVVVVVVHACARTHVCVHKVASCSH